MNQRCILSGVIKSVVGANGSQVLLGQSSDIYPC